MSLDVQTPIRIQKHKHKHADEQLSSKKRKREDGTQNDSQEATPTTSKRRRHESADTINGKTPINEPKPPRTVVVHPSQETSPFFIQTTSFYLALSPIGLAHPLESLCAEHLSPLLLTYYPPLNGVLLSYQNARLTNHPSPAHENDVGVLAKSVDEYAVSYVWVTADFTILKPMKGTWIEGHVSVQSESHLGLVCWNLFNASIEQRRLPTKWRWIGASAKDKRKKKDKNQSAAAEKDDIEGHFVDADGTKIDGVVKFRVRDLENLAEFGKDKGFMSIEGTMLTKDEEEDAMRNEARFGSVPRHRIAQRASRSRERMLET